MSKAIEKKAPPIKFLLEASDNAVGNFELAKLSEVANLRREMLTLFDRLVDVSAQAVLARWLRTIDREDLKRQLLESSTVTLERIMGEAREQIRSQGRPEELEAGPMPGPGFLRKLPPAEAHRRRRDSKNRWQERQLTAGKCRSCTKPVCRESVDLCEKHLAMKREAQRKRKGTVHTHGRHPGTLASLAMTGAIGREKRTRAKLAELGIKPERAAVSLNAAKEALLKHMPDKAHAMTQAELFEKAGVITKTTGRKALIALFAGKQIQRIGAGGVREPYRYFLKG